MLAPFVGETFYRGCGIAALRRRLDVPAAVAVSCSLFGLLHWAGRLWYVLLTGTVAGSLFAGLFVWRRNVVAAYAAHLTYGSVVAPALLHVVHPSADDDRSGRVQRLLE